MTSGKACIMDVLADPAPAPGRHRRARVIAFYLPQFHPVPENDAWLGQGFTEWTNVKRARPLYPGHQQPRRPGALGYYDLRDAAVREAQARLAREAGIEAFCYWHYWFGGGRRILERPFAEVLDSGAPNFPFCLCWANESWVGIWHGAPGRMLIEQNYPGPADHAAHFAAVLPAFLDARYVRVDGKPVFLVYSPEKLPGAAAALAQWREMAERAGLAGLYLIGMSTNVGAPCLAGFDAVMPFGPRDFLEGAAQKHVFVRVGRRFGSGKVFQALSERVGGLPWLPARYDYAELAREAFAKLPRDGRHLPCVLAGWDNTPRAGRRGIVLENFSPALLGACLEKAVAHVAGHAAEERLVFIKAWNEWAEGNYLEPDQEHGDARLAAVRGVVLGASGELEAVDAELRKVWDHQVRD